MNILLNFDLSCYSVGKKKKKITRGSIIAVTMPPPDTPPGILLLHTLSPRAHKKGQFPIPGIDKL